jgi:hypothetical protein
MVFGISSVAFAQLPVETAGVSISSTPAPIGPIFTNRGMGMDQYGYPYEQYLCGSQIPSRVWPKGCMAALKLDTSGLKKWKAEDIDVRINGSNYGPVANHDNRRDPPIIVPPNAGDGTRYHIQIVLKASDIILFEDWVNLSSLYQSGGEAFQFSVSDNDFKNSPLTASVSKEHRKITASQLVIKK